MGTWIKGSDFGAMPLQKNLTLHFSVEDSYHGSRFVTNSRDSYALRGDYPSPGAIDILTIGGSTTAELFVDDRETWSYLLGAKLTARSKSRIYVGNAGIDGQSTIGHLWNFKNWFPKIPELSPKVIIVYVGFNDSIIDAKEAIGRLPVPIRLRKTSGADDRAKQYFKNHSALFRLYRVANGALKAKVHDVGHNQIDYKTAIWSSWEIDHNREVCEDNQYQSYRNRLNELVQNIRTLGARPVLITQVPGSVRKQEGRIRYLLTDGRKPDIVPYECTNKTTIDYCIEQELSCFDLANVISFEDGDHYDGSHTTPQGSERIATAVTDWILNEKNLLVTLGIAH